MEIPFPTTLVQALWMGMGIVFARGLFKKLDEDIQNSDWYKKRGSLTQNIMKRICDIGHHWWMGLLLVVYATQPFTFQGIHLNANAELVWFGWGVVYDDLPDIPIRVQGYFGIKKEETKLNIYKALENGKKPTTTAPRVSSPH